MAAKKKSQRKRQPAEAPKPAAVIKREPFQQSLAVALTEKEIAERSHRAAHLTADAEQKELVFAEERKTQKNQLKQMRLEIRGLLSEVREGVTYRDVACEREFNYTTKTVTDRRLDNGDVLTSRPMTEKEGQTEFDGFGGAAPGAGGDVDSEFGEDESESESEDSGE